MDLSDAQLVKQLVKETLSASFWFCYVCLRHIVILSVFFLIKRFQTTIFNGKKLCKYKVKKKIKWCKTLNMKSLPAVPSSEATAHKFL